MTNAPAIDEPMDEPILVVRGLTIGLPSGGDRSTAVTDVSFTVGRGEIVCLVGESGSGKSVIAQAVMGLLAKALPLKAGQILLQGEDITHAPLSRLRELRATRMSMIFQEPMTALNPVMTCGDQIDEVLRQHTTLSDAERRAKVLAIVQEVLLPDPERIIASYPHQLSGGQRQRVGIARAIALKPDFVVADEIVSGLDVSTQAQVLDLLKGLRTEFGLSLAFISHDLSVVRHICDRVIIMRSGEVVEAGETGETFRAPKSNFTKSLISAIPLPEPNADWLDN